MTTRHSDPDHASQRVEEIADEIQRRHAQMGKDVYFGFGSGIAAQHAMQASLAICEVERALPDPLSLAFVEQVQNAELIEKALSYPFKFIIKLRLCALVRKLITQDGGALEKEIDTYWRLARAGSSEQVRDDAMTDLLSAAGPYFKWAQEVLQGEIEAYNPITVTGPVDYKLKAL